MYILVSDLFRKDENKYFKARNSSCVEEFLVLNFFEGFFFVFVLTSEIFNKNSFKTDNKQYTITIGIFLGRNRNLNGYCVVET